MAPFNCSDLPYLLGPICGILFPLFIVHLFC